MPKAKRGKLFIVTWLFCSLAAAFLLGLFWVLLGELTGLLTVGPTPLEWWVSFYLIFGVAILPGSVWGGYVVARLRKRPRW